LSTNTMAAMPTSPKDMMDAIERNLPARTGKTLAQWVALVKRGGPRDRRERVAWLRKEHGLGGATAALVAYAAEGRRPIEDYADAEALVRAMYSGKKSALRPVHDAALAAARKLGRDVTPSARKTYVSLVRKRQFGAIQPSATDRVDLGLVLPGVEAKGRLEATTTVGGGRVTHRIPLRSPRDVDAEVRRWLKAAYDHDA
jgi:Domain of unknown function (DUF5655)/Domain of unknown function (DUF4287)